MSASTQPGTALPRTRHPHWLRVVAGALLVAAPVAVAASTWDALRANNPAYPVTLLVTLLLGLWLLVSGLLARTAPRSGAARTVARVAGLLAAVGLAATLWWLKPFVATATALDALGSDATVTVTDTRPATTFEPATPTGTGLVVFPGARVDPRAYAVLARGVAEQGHPVTVLKCPYDIAFTCGLVSGPYLSDGVAVGGHSLGGVSASQVAAGSTDVPALVLWASYPLGDLSGRNDLVVASISGSQDGLSTPADIEASAANLPPDTVFTVVDGATHAMFGDYGEQPGDGTATVERADAQQQIVAATVQALQAASPAG
jgi:hypothetical protein